MPKAELVAVIARGWISIPPALIPVRFMVCGPEFSLMAAGLEIESRVGGSFTPLMVTVKDLETEASSVLQKMPSGPASVTVTTIVAVPC